MLHQSHFATAIDVPFMQEVFDILMRERKPEIRKVRKTVDLGTG
ncbi:hypothetical protein [Cognatiyoonia sediminum]|nr:hypothetical protein [Cognatiyoonia sediminum]